MIRWLDHIDTNLFLWLNGMHSSLSDPFIYSISQYGWIWIPLYVFLLYKIWMVYRVRSIPVLVSVILLVILSDQTASALIKPLVGRLRPSHEPTLCGQVHIVNGYTGGMYGFVSSHAANSFALAVFVFLVIRKMAYTMLFVFWSLLVSYSRIYLGVHYPGDILGGFIVGAVFAVTIYKILKVVFRKIYNNDLHASSWR